MTKANVLKPFWNELCQEMSSCLWSGSMTLNSDFTPSPCSVNSTIANSWFVTTVSYLQKEKWWKTYLQSFQSSSTDSVDYNSINLSSKKIRIYPETKLKSVYRKWLASSRYCYNQAIAILKEQYKLGEKLPTAYDLRKEVMSNIPEWVNSTPYNLRGNAVLDAHKAFKATKKENKLKTSFRSCRNPVNSCKLQSSNWKQKVCYPTHKTDEGTKLVDLKLNASENLPKEMPSDFNLILDRGRWYISYAIKEVKQVNLNQQVIALDPGVRTFITGFDGNKIIEIGVNSISRIVKLCKRLDRFQSEIAKAKGKENKRKRFKLRKLAQNLRIKIKNLIDECHKKTACFLTSNYSEIFLPSFESSEMVYKAKRKINSKTARNLLTWSHYRFKLTLKHQALKRGTKVTEITEEYTSKTCSKCGHIHPKLGGNKKFVCPKCGHKIDRDVNGAVNIFLKTLCAIVTKEGKIVPDTQYD